MLLLLTQYRRFTRLQFFLSWWAYSFPLAAMTVAAFTMYASVGTPWLAVIAGALLVLVTGVVAVLVGRNSVVAVARHEIRVEEAWSGRRWRQVNAPSATVLPIQFNRRHPPMPRHADARRPPGAPTAHHPACRIVHYR
ncbi:MAG: hypothetical protein U5L11_02920 [Arhodomonas sp.]|nr:hypothetical protein [Arhodomonas sp.]